jgi:hypothetical protein
LTLSLRARAPESPRATGGSHFGARGAGGSRRRSASASAEAGEGADSGGHDGGGAGMTDAQIKELNGCKTGAAREFVPRIRTGESRRLPCVQIAQQVNPLGTKCEYIHINPPFLPLHGVLGPR